MDFKVFTNRKNFVRMLIFSFFLVIVYSYFFLLPPKLDGKVPPDLKIIKEEQVGGHVYFAEINAEGYAVFGIKNPDEQKVFIEQEG